MGGRSSLRLTDGAIPAPPFDVVWHSRPFTKRCAGERVQWFAIMNSRVTTQCIACFQTFSPAQRLLKGQLRQTTFDVGSSTIAGLDWTGLDWTRVDWTGKDRQQHRHQIA